MVLKKMELEWNLNGIEKKSHNDYCYLDNQIGFHTDFQVVNNEHFLPKQVPFWGRRNAFLDPK